MGARRWPANRWRPTVGAMDAIDRPALRSRQAMPDRALAVAIEAALLVALLVVAVGTGRPGIGPVEPTPPPSGAPIVTPTPTPPPTATPTATPTPTPSAAPSPLPTPRPPLPTCAYGDLPTAHDAYDDWSITLLDTIYRLPATYYPTDLVDISTSGLAGGRLLRALVIDDLTAMADAARAAGAPFELVSAFRSHATQQATFERWVRIGGHEAALRTSARAGHSEHQLGTAIDVSTPGGPRPWAHRDWATTRAGAWLAAHAWRFGFVMSYPRDSFAQTCYDYEPWHYRYVGRDLAADIRASGLAPREYLWALQ